MAQFDPPPELLDELARRWGLTLDPPLTHDGVTAWVARGRRADGPCVLKLAQLHDEALHEAQGLRAWAGGGTVHLLDSLQVGTVTALLLESCEPGSQLMAALPAERQDEVLAGLARRLWITPPSGHPFRPLAELCAWWAAEAEQAAEAAGAGSAGLDPGVMRAGLGLFRSLPLDAPSSALLCTDLHPGNILAAQREPWLVIDPKPYVGDPTFDALQHMLNFPDRLAADATAFSDRMAALLDLDAERLRRWLFARCVQGSPGNADLAAVAATLASTV